MATTNGSSTKADAWLGGVRVRIDERRSFERMQIAAAILLVSLGLAPLTHELTVVAARPKSTLALSGLEGGKGAATPLATSSPEAPSLFPLILGLAVVVAGILAAGIVSNELKAWNDTNERLAGDLERLLAADGHHIEAWRLTLVLRDADDDGSHLKQVEAALQRHNDDGYPNVAPVRYAFDHLVLCSALLAAVLAAGAMAIRWQLTAVPAAQWLPLAQAAAGQGRDVLAGPLSPLTLLFAVALVGTSMVALLVGWTLGRSVPKSAHSPATAQSPLAADSQHVYTQA